MNLASSVNAFLQFLFGVSFEGAGAIWQRLPESLQRSVDKSVRDKTDVGKCSDEVSKAVSSWCESDQEHLLWRQNETASALGVPTGNASETLAKMPVEKRWMIDRALFLSLDGVNSRQRIREAWNDFVQEDARKKRVENLRNKAHNSRDVVAEVEKDRQEAAEALKKLAEGDDSAEEGGEKEGVDSTTGAS